MADNYYDTKHMLDFPDAPRWNGVEETTIRRVSIKHGQSITPGRARLAVEAYHRNQLEVIAEDPLGPRRRHSQTWFGFGAEDSDAIRYRVTGPYPDDSYRVSDHPDGVPEGELADCLNCGGTGFRTVLVPNNEATELDHAEGICGLCSGSGLRYAWSARARFQGGHYHVRFFVGAPGGTKAGVGTLIMAPADFENLKAQASRFDPPMIVTELEQLREETPKS